MKKFNQTVYQALIEETVGNAFYAQGLSWGGKISAIRKYTELIIRKLLDIPEGKKVTVGDSRIQKRLEEKSQNDAFFMEAIQIIQKGGNRNTHTDEPQPATEEDFDLVLDMLFRLYAYLFIDYFHRYKFGSNGQVLYTFSFLPPIIRYLTLSQLYEREPENVNIADKLALAILKSFDRETALQWVEEQREHLMCLPVNTEESMEQMKRQLGPEAVYVIQSIGPQNMYEHCRGKIVRVGEAIGSTGRLYGDLEEAAPFYQTMGGFIAKTEEELEFDGLMQFMFMGRKKQSKL